MFRIRISPRDAHDRLDFLAVAYPCLFSKELTAAFHVDKKAATSRRMTVAGSLRKQFSTLTPDQIQDFRDNMFPGEELGVETSAPSAKVSSIVQAKKAKKRAVPPPSKDIRSFFHVLFVQVLLIQPLQMLVVQSVHTSHNSL